MINIDTNNPMFELKDGLFVPYTKNKNIKTLGSGLIYSSNGYIITNTHVIKDAEEIFVTLIGGEKFKAQLVEEYKSASKFIIEAIFLGFEKNSGRDS